MAIANWSEILREVDKLYELHELGASDPKKCREFNSKASLFLSKMEDMGVDQMADRMMDILGGCSPKEFSTCDNRQNTKGALERLRDKVKANLGQ
ncbi:MAG: hypothetical protein ACE14P_09590 [Methanotrichaceae archaeon]